MSPETKFCTKCKIQKSLDSFSPDKRTPSGKTAHCKSCKNSYLLTYYYSTEGNIKRKLSFQKYNKTEQGKKLKRLQRIKYDNSEKGKLKKRELDKKYTSKPEKRAIKNAVGAKYRCTKLNATPKWLTKSQLDLIKMFYARAKYLTIETGIPHQVDHIIPLQGENVCGLHVPWNLRIVTKSENSSKGNKLK